MSEAAVMATEKQAVPKGYKQTEVGVIPKDWDIIAIDKLNPPNCPTVKAGPFGSSLTKETYVPYGYKVYGQEQVIKGDHNYGDYFIDEDKFRELRSCEVNKGDILLSLVGTAGKLLVIPSNAMQGIINPRLLRFRFDKTCVNSYFFKNLFESEYIQKHLSSSAQGGTMAVLNAGILKNLVIPLPPLKEQTAIANALSDMDALLTEQEQLIAKKQAIKTATMQQLLTGKTRLPQFATHTDGEHKGQPKGMKPSELGEIPEDWECYLLNDVIDSLSSGATPFRGNPHFYKGTNRWITSGELNYGLIEDTYEKISDEAIKKSNLKVHPAGTFLMAITGLEAAGTRGACGIVGKPSTTNQSCMAIYPNKKLSSQYLFHWYVYNGDDLALKYCQGTKQLSYTAGLLRTLPIVLPTNLKEQTDIANILSDMDDEIQALEQRLAKTRQIKQGMMQELLTGKTRLPVEAHD